MLHLLLMMIITSWNARILLNNALRGDFVSPFEDKLINNYEEKLMKFVSKFTNHRLVLRPGVPSEPITGRTAIPGLYVKFEQGMVDVKDPEMVDRMLKHPRFGADFILLKEDEIDPYLETRKNIEPDHIITEMKYGHPDKVIGNKQTITLNKKQKEIFKEMVKDQAGAMAKEMLKELMKNKEIKEMVGDSKKELIAKATAESQEESNDEDKVN